NGPAMRANRAKAGAPPHLGLSVEIEGSDRAGHRRQCGTSASIRSSIGVTGAGVPPRSSEATASTRRRHDLPNTGGGMRRLGPGPHAAAALAAGLVLLVGGLVP